MDCGLFSVAIMVIVCLMVLFFFGVCSAGMKDNFDDVILTVVYESSDQGEEGMMAVSKVIQNRVKERGMSHYDVVHENFQFPCWLADCTPSQSRKITNNDFHEAHDAWNKAIFFGDEAFWSTANIYMRNELMPNWLRNALKTGAVIELGTLVDHTFYREVRYDR